MNKILIIDDNKYLRFALSILIEENGYKALRAGNKHKAIKELKNKKPGLIILDKKMHDCDGFDLISEIRYINRNVPVIMLTAYEEKDTADQAIKLGVNLFMTKPYDINEVISNIRKFIK